MKKREYLDEQIHALIGVKGSTIISIKLPYDKRICNLHILFFDYGLDKSPASALKETSLIDEWVALTEERNAVLVPTPGSGIPGAPPPEDW